ncbi:MAG TPA: hypothetical protein VGP72_04055 [Planctomycetota bacterium]|jgi:hypothetical protein
MALQNNVGVVQAGKQGGDASGGLALGANTNVALGAGTGLLGVGVGVGQAGGGTGADASAQGGDASDNSYIGSITINA